MIRILTLLIITIFCLCLNAFAIDWKKVHEAADARTSEEALVIYAKNQSSFENLYILGLTYLNEHKDKQAEETFRKMLIKQPESIQASWGLAEVLRRKKDIEESQKILEEVIKSEPGFSPAYISLAYLRYMQADFNGAVKLALRVQKQGKDNVDLSNYARSYLIFAGAKGMIASRGGLLSKVLNGTQVLPNLKRAEKLQPDSPAVLFGLGSFYFLAPGVAGGNVDKALEYLERALAADPLFADAYVRLAQIHKSKGDNEKYEFYINKALEIDLDNELAKDATSGICKFNCVTVEE